jgi:alpha-ketoglutarate-dependent 2,4-dichlorophenoxyacetate dioxygenase
MRAVYDALPQETKDRIAGLSARHNYFHSRRKAGAKVGDDSPLAPYMRAEQPLVRTSASGRPTLFVGAHTEAILGMGEDESRALIEELIAFATQPQFVYAHLWRAGDILIWDNRCTAHARTDFDASERRLMKRVTVGDTVGVMA